MPDNEVLFRVLKPDEIKRLKVVRCDKVLTDGNKKEILDLLDDTSFVIVLPQHVDIDFISLGDAE